LPLAPEVDNNDDPDLFSCAIISYTHREPMGLKCWCELGGQESFPPPVPDLNYEMMKEAMERE
jgi:hypothetical protein